MPPTKRNHKQVIAAVIPPTNGDLDSKPVDKIIEEVSPEYNEHSKNEEVNTVLLGKRSVRPILSRNAKSKAVKYTQENEREDSVETNNKKKKMGSKETKIGVKLLSKNLKKSVQNEIPKKKLKIDATTVEEKIQEPIPTKIKKKSATEADLEKFVESSNEIIVTKTVQKVFKGRNKKTSPKKESDDELPIKKNIKIAKTAKKSAKRSETVISSETSESEIVLTKNDANEKEANYTEKVLVKGKNKKISKDEKIKINSKKKHNDDNFQKEIDNLEKEESDTEKVEEISEIDTESVIQKQDEDDFDSDKPNSFKITSWNISGLRAWIKKVELGYFTKENPDIICFQEIKCTEDQVPDGARLSGYHPYWLGSATGHAGVAIYSKRMPLNVEYGIGDKEFDNQSRIITAEYNKFYLINVYVPNSGRQLVTLPKRLEWNNLFEKFIDKLNKNKPVIICGDMNVAHQEIDLANPKTNKRNAGFTQEERDGMTHMLSMGFVDTYRHFYPNLEKAYTFWQYMKNCRAKNIGWRLDYFIVSERFLPKVVDNKIRSNVMGSDHCPITLFLNV